ncbi:CocE/NonD family hydrolase [Nocardia altamirensis]|uniref:CocE/NonD family hydrolase n=1 Tax=Nocardia altamirensis TaxID=472158 RepID=UPI000A02CA7F|nr:CocE/NonD family hydrolase [Nocardia altamirensis]
MKFTISGSTVATTLLVTATLLFTMTACAPPDRQAATCEVVKEVNVAATMRDGTVLYADIYRPKTDEPVPVVLIRNQYGKDVAALQPYRYMSPHWLATNCYLVVHQDVRGQYASKGTFYEFTQEVDDGYDSVEWAAALPGANGNVGMYGSSYLGATQWLAAAAAPPHLTTIVPMNTSSDYYEGWTYEGGQFRLGFVEPWAMHTIIRGAAANRGDTALVKELDAAYLDIAKWLRHRPYNNFPPFKPGDPKVAPYYFDWIQHSTNDDYWTRLAPERHHSTITVPALHIGGWYDAFLDGTIRNFTGMTTAGGSPEARAQQRIVIGPWDHKSYSRPPAKDYRPSPMLAAIGKAGEYPLAERLLAWFDQHLKGRPSDGRAAVDYFEMGSNVWRQASAWPIPGTEFTKYFLSSDGHAASLLGDGKLTATAPASGQPADEFTYDPGNPVPSVGGHSCCDNTGGQQGPYDQQVVEARPDVLVYTGAPLSADTRVTGPISVELYAASSAVDTDWTAKLVDVHPDGTARNLNNGILRASFRESSSQPTPIVPGEIYKYTIKIWPTSNMFRAGHKIRLEISSSDYPQYAPNPNTGTAFGTSDEIRIANQRIYHDPAHPSSITLPIIPGDK